MAIDGFILNALLKNIAVQCPFKVNKIQQVGEHHYVLHAFSTQRFTILIALDAQSNRIQLTQQAMTQTHQTSFLTSLKKYIEGATCNEVVQSGHDRHFKMVFDTTNDVFEHIQVVLYVELMGQYANAILVSDEGKIIDAHTKIYPDKNSSRFIMVHAPFQPIQSQAKVKIDDPEVLSKISTWMDIEGCSPQLAKELEFRFNMGESMSDVFYNLQHSQTLFVSKQDSQKFHIIPFLHYQTQFNEGECHAMLHEVYSNIDHQRNIKVLTQDIAKVIMRELKKQRLKKQRLQDDLTATQNSYQFKDWADYVMTYAYQIKKGDTQIIVPSFEDESVEIKIPLQPHLTGIENANLYYKKFQKQNSSIHYIHEQIEITETMIQYLESCEMALSFANVSEAIQIKEELMLARLMRSSKVAPSKAKKAPIKILHYVGEDFVVYVGKNNIQNDYLTFKFAQKNDMWFHVKDAPSAHVILRTQKPLSETMIRTAANLCAIYSKYSMSSSVEVMYTKISNIKKIPKAPLGMVSVKQYTTIFIDPDKSIVSQLKV
ncbi:MAG: NFACT family protein [Erysipelothrix sp.]|jgi:predicted ribosome quality control (RQC) complex YloA/Tae2 family protein|nr:NFACT family protein [Erysipelothrix sp.]